MIDQVKIVDICLGKLAVAFFVFMWFDDVEFFFPKTNQLGIHYEHIGDFTD